MVDQSVPAVANEFGLIVSVLACSNSNNWIQ